MQHEKHKDREN